MSKMSLEKRRSGLIPGLHWSLRIARHCQVGIFVLQIWHQSSHSKHIPSQVQLILFLRHWFPTSLDCSERSHWHSGRGLDRFAGWCFGGWFGERFNASYHSVIACTDLHLYSPDHLIVTKAFARYCFWKHWPSIHLMFAIGVMFVSFDCRTNIFCCAICITSSQGWRLSLMTWPSERLRTLPGGTQTKHHRDGVHIFFRRPVNSGGAMGMPRSFIPSRVTTSSPPSRLNTLLPVWFMAVYTIWVSFLFPIPGCSK